MKKLISLSLFLMLFSCSFELVCRKEKSTVFRPLKRRYPRKYSETGPVDCDDFGYPRQNYRCQKKK